MDNIIYILINQAMPGYVKIGKTSTSLEQRIKELSSSTSVPLPFECFYAARVQNADKVEKLLHDAFDDNRTNPRREFFQISPERIASALKLAELENITPGRDIVESIEDQNALDAARKKRSVFNFDMVAIPVGSELSLTHDPNIKAIVANNKQVVYEGNLYSLSEAARLALITLGYNWKAVQGPAYWLYNGETLDEIRQRMELGE